MRGRLRDSHYHGYGQREGLERLGDALTRIDSQLTDAGYKPRRAQREPEKCIQYAVRHGHVHGRSHGGENGVRRSGGQRRVYFRGVCLYLSAGYPHCGSGKWISRPILEVILEYRDKGLPVQGTADQSPRTIRVVQKD